MAWIKAGLGAGAGLSVEDCNALLRALGKGMAKLEGQAAQSQVHTAGNDALAESDALALCPLKNQPRDR